MAEKVNRVNYTFASFQSVCVCVSVSSLVYVGKLSFLKSVERHPRGKLDPAISVPCR